MATLCESINEGLLHPEYLSSKYSKFIFHRDGNDVVMHRNGGANRKVLASYGQNGLKENSGTAILGGAFLILNCH